ncbi:MAG: DUF992 domain-containing protein [Rhizobiaceae bacterium]
MKHVLAAALVAASFAVIPASAQDRTEVGLLDCKVEGGAGFIVGSSKDVSCIFTSADSSRAPEAYVGSINKVGLDVGVTGAGVMKWSVLAPTSGQWPDGALAGNYVGASAEATAAVGVGANVLIGGSSDTIMLQPLSVQGQTGLNVAVGVTDFNLQPAG